MCCVRALLGQVTPAAAKAAGAVADAEVPPDVVAAAGAAADAEGGAKATEGLVTAGEVAAKDQSKAKVGAKGKRARRRAAKAANLGKQSQDSPSREAVNGDPLLDGVHKVRKVLSGLFG